MADLSTAVAIFGKPYTITKSRLGAITKIYEDKYTCDPKAIKALFEQVGEKIAFLRPENVGFSFLFSFEDKTHQDGVLADIGKLETISSGKKTDRIILKWVVKNVIDGTENEASITVRITNPINPFLILQAALSKSVNDIDNLEYELGSTCVTVDGTGQMYADEIFLIIQKWIDARQKPHAFIKIHENYQKVEWLVNIFSKFLLPLFCTSIISLFIYKIEDQSMKISLIPIALVTYFIISSIGKSVTSKMSEWSNRTRYFSMFQLTDGDIDNITKLGAKSTNSCIKLFISGAINLILNIIAGYFCIHLFPQQ